jgi:hypothetical protein
MAISSSPLTSILDPAVRSSGCALESVLSVFSASSLQPCELLLVVRGGPWLCNCFANASVLPSRPFHGGLVVLMGDDGSDFLFLCAK